ncbi:MAG: SAM-dependent methyltransferase [Spirochaetaceae bacterium]|nr:SAM-dependent methyltransferase [Spirochaetaceae bacterium]
MSDFSVLKKLFFEESSGFLRGIISNPVKNAEFKKIRITPVNAKDGLCFHVEKFTEKQAFHENLTQDGIFSLIKEIIPQKFRQAVFETESGTVSVLANKKGKISIITKSNGKPQCNCADGNSGKTEKLESAAPKTQNRKKQYILQEGVPVPFLVELGVMTKDGAVIAQKYDKFRQINRFLEYIDDVLEDALLEPDGTRKSEISIVDFGCGKSYLTFAVYYYLTELKKLRARIVGLDLKADVIEHCNALAEKLGYSALKFQTGDIAHFESNTGFDMMITLHACDTATDYALARAVNWNIPVVLSVPCCQHELNKAVEKQSAAPEFDALLKYGIIRERFLSLATDAMRAELLESSGYSVQLLEFIDMAHTPKNILIRAVKKHSAGHGNSCAAGSTAAFSALKKALGGKAPILEQLFSQ